MSFVPLSFFFLLLTAEPEAENQPIEEDISDDDDDNMVIPGGVPGGMFPGGRGRGFPGFPQGGMPFPGGGMAMGKMRKCSSQTMMKIYHYLMFSKCLIIWTDMPEQTVYQIKVL